MYVPVFIMICYQNIAKYKISQNETFPFYPFIFMFFK